MISSSKMYNYMTYPLTLSQATTTSRACSRSAQNENAPRNCTYLSKTTQNQLINILGDVIRDEILGEIRKATYFSISADEAADCSNKEQLSLTIRFVDSSDKVREEFIEFDHCKEGTTGGHWLN